MDRDRAFVSGSRVNVLGVGLHPRTLASAAAEMMAMAKDHIHGYACFCNVNSLVSCLFHPSLGQVLNQGLAFTDGMPLVWLCRLAGFPDAGRVYGPDLMLAVCDAGQKLGLRHYFYGGGPGRAQALAQVLADRFPGLKVAGVHTPPKLAPGDLERPEVIARINRAKPDIIWVGLGTPKQDLWMARHRPLLKAPVLAGVGAAFDFHTGCLRQAPAWMQRGGMEWLFRLLTEPRRLALRYLVYNPLFLVSLILQSLGLFPPAKKYNHEKSL